MTVATFDKTDDITQLVIDSVIEGVCVVRDMRICWANTAFYEMLDAEEGEHDILEKDVAPLLYQKDRDRLADMQARQAGGDDGYKTVTFDFRLMSFEGRVKRVTCRAQRILYEGKPASLCCFLDVTDNYQQLAEQSRRATVFQSAFRLVPDLFMVVDANSREMLEVNPAFINATGFRRDDVIGARIESLNIWADTTFFNRFYEELKTNTSMSDVPVVFKTRGGVIRHYRMFAQKILEEDQLPLILLVARDVTEDLIQAQELQKSRDSAELANRAKSEFLANMSHELRTPLNAILGFAEIIRDKVFGKDMGDRYSEYASDIHDSGQHLLSIINDILDLSKVEAGRLDAHLTWLDPLPSLDMCVALIQQRAYENGLTLSTDISEDILIEADERLIKQIALNLLSNAVKFTVSGGHIGLSLAKHIDGSVTLAVEDSGIGMTPEEIRIAKRPFGQVDSSLSRKHQGSGLGLPLVSAFAEELSATMAIHSVPGEGTRVAITFPPEKCSRRDKRNKGTEAQTL